MTTLTIQPSALAMLANTEKEFSVSAQARDEGWVVYVHDEQGDHALLDFEGKTAAVFDALQAVEQRLLALGIERFEVKQLAKEEGYDEWLSGEVQEALNDSAPLIPHNEAMRRIRAAIKAK